VATSVTQKLPVVWKIKLLLGNNFLLWMNRTDEFPNLPVHPKEMAFDCHLVVHPLHTLLYSFCYIYFSQSPLNPLSGRHCVCLASSSLSPSLCSQGHKEMLCHWRPYFLLTTTGLCITVSNFAPDCAISLGDV